MHIDRLLVVAGPSGSGKSHLIQKLRAGELPRVAEALHLGETGSWRTLLVREVPQLDGERLGTAMFHYDLLRPWRPRRTPRFGEDETLGAVLAAATPCAVTVVTLWASPEVLLQRIVERRALFVSSLIAGRPWNSEVLRPAPSGKSTAGPAPKPKRSLRKAFAIVQELRRLRAKARLFGRPEEVLALYDRWLEHCAAHEPAHEPGGCEHWLFDTASPEARLIPLSDWPAVSGRGRP